jgi:poly [ADP-ribose] polymerase 7/11/12/13
MCKVSKLSEERGVTALEQEREWLEENPLHTRRPDLELVQCGCHPALLEWVEKSWSDNADNRPTFRETVEFLGKVLEGRPYWGQGGSKLLVSLSQGTSEFGEIENRFRQTLPQATLVQIDRVQNGPLFASFLAQTENLKKQMGANWDEGRMRQMLFHGTNAVEAIVNSVDGHGFLPLLAGTSTGAIWGKGTYFARDARYSDDYARTLPSGHKQMILVDVLVGLSTQGAADMNVCPLLPGQSDARYNSLVDREQDPSIFVVQHSNQAYPSYLITYH